MTQQATVSPSIRKRAQESSNAIARMYISMRHLLNRGFYKPMGISGASLRNALLTLKPEIYEALIKQDELDRRHLRPKDYYSEDIFNSRR